MKGQYSLGQAQEKLVLSLILVREFLGEARPMGLGGRAETLRAVLLAFSVSPEALKNVSGRTENHPSAISSLLNWLLGVVHGTTVCKSTIYIVSGSQHQVALFPIVLW